MSFLELAQQRYSCRSFSDKDIPEDVLNQILEAGRVAPTAKNYQPQRIYVFQGDKVQNLKDFTPFLFDANVVLLVCVNTDEQARNTFSKKGYGVMDISIVTTHMMMMASELGVGTTWVGHADMNKIKEYINLPNNIDPHCLLVMGYPSENAAPSERHENRKHLDETVIRV